MSSRSSCLSLIFFFDSNGYGGSFRPSFKEERGLKEEKVQFILKGLSNGMSVQNFSRMMIDLPDILTSVLYFIKQTRKGPPRRILRSMYLLSLLGLFSRRASWMLATMRHRHHSHSTSSNSMTIERILISPRLGLTLCQSCDILGYTHALSTGYVLWEKIRAK